MKKYLIQLVRKDLESDKGYLIHCNRAIEEGFDNTYYLKRKQSLENKILKHEAFLIQLEGMNMIYKAEHKQ